MHKKFSDFSDFNLLKTRIHGAIREDLVASVRDKNLSDLSKKVSFNGLPLTDCRSNWRYDRRQGRFEFNLALGDCDMTGKIVTRNDSKFIKFSERISFSGGPVKQQLYFGNTPNFKFSCLYSTSTSTDTREITVWSNTTKPREVEEFVSWDNTMNLAFYKSQKFAKVIRTGFEFCKNCKNSLISGLSDCIMSLNLIA